MVTCERRLIVPIYKGKGEKGNCRDYRGISLRNHITKVLEIILERARVIIKKQLGEELYGYSRNRNTRNGWMSEELPKEDGNGHQTVMNRGKDPGKDGEMQLVRHRIDSTCQG